jgi:hypothetical protein
MLKAAFWGVLLNQSLPFCIPPGTVSASGRSCGDRRAPPGLFPARHESSNGGELSPLWGTAKNSTKDVNPPLIDIWTIVLCLFGGIHISVASAEQVWVSITTQ